ncbi:MAG TPA: hypothetical protein DEV93_12830 [Chloroflexi bacterium]|nr:hypothetical protein [Chloroflexota bacterium]
MPRELMDVIDTAVRFQESSIQDLVFPLVERLASELAADPDIRASLEAGERYRGRMGRKILPIGRPGAAQTAMEP